jgi:hypothetical protein
MLIAVTLRGHDLPTMALGGHPDEVRGMPEALLGGLPRSNAEKRVVRLPLFKVPATQEATQVGVG